MRPDGVFLDERDQHGDPLPEFISARPDDLSDLMSGLLEANDRMHRYLIHHVLAERKFTPPGMVFPVSSVMLDRIDDYRATLQAHSGPLMPFIEWPPTPSATSMCSTRPPDLYRYFDCTAEAEFLYACVRRTVEHDLPREIEYLRRRGDAIGRIMERIEMPDRIRPPFQGSRRFSLL